MAQDLLAWTQGLCLEGEVAKAEPKRLRYVFWHTVGRLVRHGRTTTLRLARTWPWAREFTSAFRRLRALPILACAHPHPSSVSGRTHAVACHTSAPLGALREGAHRDVGRWVEFLLESRALMSGARRALLEASSQKNEGSRLTDGIAGLLAPAAP